jgi:rare lipoprotein A
MHRPLRRWAALALVLLGAGCATRAPERDGPPSDAPPNLAQRPDAVPRVEPIKAGGPNRPYEVLGRRYVPLASDVAFEEKGLASWYGRKFHGRPTASGERYDMHEMTAAHKLMPLPSYARVRNPANGREVIVRINDRGPFVDGRVIDLSYAAAVKLGLQGGLGPVEVKRLTHREIEALASD